MRGGEVKQDKGGGGRDQRGDHLFWGMDLSYSSAVFYENLTLESFAHGRKRSNRFCALNALIDNVQLKVSPASTRWGARVRERGRKGRGKKEEHSKQACHRISFHPQSGTFTFSN